MSYTSFFKVVLVAGIFKLECQKNIFQYTSGLNSLPLGLSINKGRKNVFGDGGILGIFEKKLIQ